MVELVARIGKRYGDPTDVLKSLGRMSSVVSISGSRREQELFLEHCSTVVEGMLKVLNLEQSCLDAIKALSALIDAYDSYTGGHSHSVRDHCMDIGRAMGLSGGELGILECAAYMHDIGKIGVGPGIVKKPKKLTAAEKKRVKTHPGVGAEIVRRLGFLDDAVPLILHHHERYDGSGYPRGLGKNKIPLGARIICVADAFDAMTSERSYQKAMKGKVALEKLQKGAGTQFDPKVVRVIIRTVRWRERSS